MTSRGREAPGRSRPIKAWTPGLCALPWLATPSGCCHRPCWEELLTPCRGSTHGVKSHEGLDAGLLHAALAVIGPAREQPLTLQGGHNWRSLPGLHCTLGVSALG